MAPKNQAPITPETKPESSSEYETDTSASDSDSKAPNNKPIAEPSKSEPKKPNIKPESKNAPDTSSKIPTFRDVGEIDILKEMIEFEAKNNVSPNGDMDAFLDFIKKNLNVVVSKNQLYDKIRRIKKKYEVNKGKDRNLMKGNEKAAFELSEKVWDGEDRKTVVALRAEGSESAVKKTPIRKRKAGEKDGALEKKKKASFENVNKDGALEEKITNENGKKDGALVGNRVSFLGLSNEEKLLRIGAELFEGDEEIEGSEKWRKLVREEMEICIKQLDVKKAMMRLVLDNMDD